MILKIDGKQYDFFNEVSVSLKYDSIASSFGFNFYFNPDNPDHVELTRPFTYRRCTIEHNEELLITGTLLSQTFNSSSNTDLIPVGGYSLPGILEDCEIPVKNYPLQTQNLTLRNIADRLFKSFGIKYLVDSKVAAKMDKVIGETTANEKQSVKGYLTELAAQRNILISHNEKGEVVFTLAQTDKAPLIEFDLSKGSIPGVSMSLNCNGQAMHSEITVIKEASIKGGNAGQSSITNPFVSVFRPSVKIQTSGDDNTTGQAARMALSTELRAVVLTITLDRWAIDGKIIRPNNIITVTNKELNIRKRTKFFIEEVSFTGNEAEQTSVLTCVLPSVYDDSKPFNIFVQ